MCRYLGGGVGVGYFEMAADSRTILREITQSCCDNTIVTSRAKLASQRALFANTVLDRYHSTPLFAIAVLLCSRFLSAMSTSPDLSPADWVLDIVICTAAALTGKWLIPAGILVACAMFAWWLLPGSDTPLGYMVYCIAVFSAVAQGRKKESIFFTCLYAVLACMELIKPSMELFQVVGTVVLLVILLALVWLIGIMTRRYEVAMADLRLAHAKSIQEERREIARDLHDSVASAMARMIMRAEEALLGGIYDPGAVDALNNIVAVGREGSRDLRAMLVSLRNNDGDDTPTPVGLWNIPSLGDVVAKRIGELQSAGFAVDFSVNIDEKSMPTAIRNTLGKVVFEATSNIMKHGLSASTCSVLIEAGSSEAELVFVNVAERKQARADGLGLIGLRERLLVFNGELEHFEVNGAFVLRARITY